MKYRVEGVHVWQQDAPALFAEITGRLLMGDRKVMLKGESYSVLRHQDTRGDFFVLMPER